MPNLNTSCTTRWGVALLRINGGVPGTYAASNHVPSSVPGGELQSPSAGGSRGGGVRRDRGGDPSGWSRDRIRACRRSDADPFEPRAPDRRSGAVSVSKPSGTATGGTFTVKPVISKFTPITGPVGTVVTITGTTFTGATSVMFSTTAAVPTSVSYSKIVVPVPTGATTGKIFVTTPSGTAASVAVFTVT